MRVSKEEIETIKQSHDLRAVIESYGVSLKKKGTNYVGLCPFHKEKTPSFYRQLQDQPLSLLRLRRRWRRDRLRLQEERCQFP